MNIMMKMRSKIKSGFSLAEFIAALGLFSILMTSLGGVIVVGIRYYKDSDKGIKIQNSVRRGIEGMTSEIRTAVPDDDPGLFGNTPTGYKAISPSIDPNGVLYPNVNLTQTDYLIFNKPDYTYYAPGNSGWTSLDPRNYKKIRYYVRDTNVLTREETLFNADGSVLNTSEAPLAEVTNGSLELICTVQQTSGSMPYYRIRLTATRDKKQFSLTSNCMIPGGVF